MITHRVTVTEINAEPGQVTAPEAAIREVFRQEFSALNLPALVRDLNKPTRKPRKGRCEVAPKAEGAR